LKLSNRLGLVVVLLMLTIVSSLLVGVLAGPYLVAPFLIGVMLVGLPSAFSTGLRWTAAGVTALVIAAMAGGIALGEILQVDQRAIPSSQAWRAAADVWKNAAEVARDFPLMGVGFGGFASVQPYYKSADVSHTSALSSALQWWAESGLVGVLLVALGIGWALFKLPAAWRRVGGADRAMAYGLVGALACFGIFSAMHWSIQLTAVALAASAVAGTANRWLAGGTDLFLERV
jgi:O-antigen ligase